MFGIFNKKKQGIVISGFPGIGKSHLVRMGIYNVSDSDSSHHDKANFPANYIEHIKKERKEYDVVLVSSHKEVRLAMADAGIEYFLVFPWGEAKNHFLNRYRQRGSHPKFIALLDQQWDNWIQSCCLDEGTIGIWRLDEGDYLTDIVEEIINFDNPR